MLNLLPPKVGTLTLKAYNRVLRGGVDTQHPERNWLNSISLPFKALFHFPKRIITKFPKMKFLDDIPFGLLLFFWLAVLTIIILLVNKLRYGFFVDLITKSFPEAVTVPIDSTGQPLYMSALDRMFAEFNAINNVGYFIFFAVMLRTFLKTVWDTYNPRKRQVLART